MKIKVRKKPCGHCLFTDKHVPSKENIAMHRATALSGKGLFKCHEHSCGTVGCYNALRLQPDRFDVDEVEKVNINGDLKNRFSNMTRKEMDNYIVTASC